MEEGIGKSGNWRRNFVAAVEIRLQFMPILDKI